jgi:hypothetical protein
MQYLVNKALLDLYDKYDGDLGLLDERWASREDREAFSSEQIRTLGEYLDQVRFAESGCLSQELRARVENRVRELEDDIDPEVVMILKKRELRPADPNQGKQGGASDGDKPSI